MSNSIYNINQGNPSKNLPNNQNPQYLKNNAFPANIAKVSSKGKNKDKLGYKHKEPKDNQ